jgi:rRNA-processing protein FCF1
MQIIPDTNFLIYAVRYKLLDSISSYKLILVEQVAKELEKISKSKKTKLEHRKAAKIALDFLKSQNPIIIKQKGKADDVILAIAKKIKIPIATMDKEMATRAKKDKIKIIKLRQKKYLQG